MSNMVTLGGERLGGGKKSRVALHGYERSTHDLSFIWRSTMSVGTLVPFMSEVALPGDTFDIDLDVDVKTVPTIGPLFGSFKLHLDVFSAPIRLYHSALHMNMLNIGMNMANISLPKLVLEGNTIDFSKDVDNQHVNPSSLLKYLGISGIGWKQTPPVRRKFNAVPLLAYWDIYKQYYANKQETNGAMIHTDPSPQSAVIASASIRNTDRGATVALTVPPTAAATNLFVLQADTEVSILFTTLPTTITAEDIQYEVVSAGFPNATLYFTQVFQQWSIDYSNRVIIFRQPLANLVGRVQNFSRVNSRASGSNLNGIPVVYRFPLKNIDDMRTRILQFSPMGEYVIRGTDSITTHAPYVCPLLSTVGKYAATYTQEGLGLRTYASDLFNNWLEQSIIDGGTGITAVTSVNVVGNKFTIDELNLSKKVYDMLNRIAVSGGTYDDWLDAVYSHDRNKSIENPMYMGGLLRNVVFEEVVSVSDSEISPLGTLAGKGRLGNVNKGGKVVIKVDEPSYIMGIVSLVPNIDYSQGNKWDVNLKNMNDFHKPALDEIGFQNLVTEQMAWWDTTNVDENTNTFRSAGKQPAWLNYMTNVNRVFGNFAIEGNQMWMVLNRQYEYTQIANIGRINDLTTYIDPSKFNQIFADVRIDAQNFWTQIACKIEARRKMSAKVMPNL